MDDICPKCGLPKNLCVCEEIARESQKIKVREEHRRFGKNTETKELLKTLKKKLACGGTHKGNEIELQGKHKKRLKELMIKHGFKEELIDA